MFGNRIQGYRHSKRMAVNGIVKRLCKEAGEVAYVDLWDSFVGKEDMYVRDGLHLSGKGAAVFAEGCQGRLPVAWVSTIFKLVGQGGLSKKAKKVQADAKEYRETHTKQKLNVCA